MKIGLMQYGMRGLAIVLTEFVVGIGLGLVLAGLGLAALAGQSQVLSAAPMSAASDTAIMVGAGLAGMLLIIGSIVFKGWLATQVVTRVK